MKSVEDARTCQHDSAAGSDIPPHDVGGEGKGREPEEKGVEAVIGIFMAGHSSCKNSSSNLSTTYMT